MRKAAANVAKMSVALPFYVLGFIVGLIVRLFRLSAGGFMLGIQDASGIEIRLNRESNE